jgi:triosephosphate isomerase
MRKIAAGNWKMHKTAQEAKAFFELFASLVPQAKSEILFAVPFTALPSAVEAAQGKNFLIGAQNMHDEVKGAFTGEISAPMLKSVGASFVILGHSERRHLFLENNAFICRKLRRACEENLRPILCVGETQADREEGKTTAVLQTQLSECLEGLSFENAQKLMIAYEPVWAIGTGKSATPEIAEQAHLICRTALAEKWGKEAAKKIPLLYGGSVTEETIEALIVRPNIDGVLVGGASLDAQKFANIVNRIN